MVAEAPDFLFLPFGSLGDLLPHIGVALELKQRGHRVHFINSPAQEKLISEVGLANTPLGKPEDFEEPANDPRLWHPIFGLRIVMNSVVRAAPVQLELIEEHAGKETVLVASILSMGAQLARDKLKLRYANLMLQPSAFATDDPEVLIPAGWKSPMIPEWAIKAHRRLSYNIGDQFVIHKTRKLWRDHGLTAPKKFFGGCSTKADLNLAMFPEWFARRYEGWPASARHASFPLFSLPASSHETESADQLSDQDLTNAIVVTMGTEMRQGEDLLKQIMQHPGLQHERIIIAHRHVEFNELPSNTRWVKALAFGEVLHKCKAIIHHGGIGTASQALASGCPQFIVAHGFDQYDTGTRIEKLGVGNWTRRHHQSALSDLQSFLDSIDKFRDRLQLPPFAELRPFIGCELGAGELIKLADS